MWVLGSRCRSLCLPVPSCRVHDGHDGIGPSVSARRHTERARRAFDRWRAVGSALIRSCVRWSARAATTPRPANRSTASVPPFHRERPSLPWPDGVVYSPFLSRKGLKPPRLPPVRPAIVVSFRESLKESGQQKSTRPESFGRVLAAPQGKVYRADPPSQGRASKTPLVQDVRTER